MHDRQSRQSPVRLVRWLIGLFAMSAALLASCASGGAAGPRLAPNQTFVYPNTTISTALDVPHVLPDLALDPAFMGDLYSQRVLNMIQMQLYTFDASVHVIPDAAATLPQISPDGKTWTVHLRPNLLWSDGTPLTAPDFAAGIAHDLNPTLCTMDSPQNDPNPANRTSCAGGQPLGFFLSYLQGATAYSTGAQTTLPGVETPDPQTIIFHLTSPVSFFLQDLATIASAPLERSVFAKYGGNYTLHYIDGVAQSGPFVISAWRDPALATVKDPQHSTELIFTPNPHWLGKTPYLTKVVMPLEKDLNTEYNQYQQGALDFTEVPPQQYPFTHDLPDFNQVQALAIDFFALNWLDQPFTSLLVRQSFDLALNKQLLVDSIFQGATLPTNHIIPEGIGGYNQNLHNPPDVSGTTALTGNQTLAQNDIKQVATACVARYDKNLCQYIIGTTPPTQYITDIATNNAGCPHYQVGTTTVNNVVQTTQTPIVVYVTSKNPNRVELVQAAVEEWRSVLCLNVTVQVDDHFVGQVYSHLGTQTAQSIWALGYAADYPDPQDFTTNLFDPTSYNNAGNIGLTQGQDIVLLMRAADVEKDPAKRMLDYQNVEQQLVNQVALIPYDQPKMLFRVRQTVVGLTMPATEVLSDQLWPNIFIEAS